MNAKDLILEIFRETDFLMELKSSDHNTADAIESQQQSIAAINKACSAFLNGQDFEPHVERFLRRQMEVDVYEEFEIWGKFSPPPQFIDSKDDD
jgi:hypothetical protein